MNRAQPHSSTTSLRMQSRAVGVYQASQTSAPEDERPDPIALPPHMSAIAQGPHSRPRTHIQRYLWKPIALAFSRKHRRQMSSEYLRMSPILDPHTRQAREPLP